MRAAAIGALALLAVLATQTCFGAWSSHGGSPHLLTAVIAFVATGIVAATAGIASATRGIAIAAVLAFAYAFGLAASYGCVVDGTLTVRFFLFLATMIAAIGATALPFAQEARS